MAYINLRVGTTVSEKAWELLNEKLPSHFKGGVRETPYDLLAEDLRVDADFIEEVGINDLPTDGSKPLAYFHSPGKYSWALLTLNRAHFPELFRRSEC